MIELGPNKTHSLLEEVIKYIESLSSCIKDIKEKEIYNDLIKVEVNENSLANLCCEKAQNGVKTY